GPEPEEDDVHALLCLTTGRVFRRNKWSGDWQVAHHDPQRATHYQWPLPDAGPFIAWRDGYEFDRVIDEAKAIVIEFNELHRRWYGQPGYNDPDGGFGRPRLAAAWKRMLRHDQQRAHDANIKAQRNGQMLAQLRRSIEHLRPDDAQQWPVEDGHSHDKG